MDRSSNESIWESGGIFTFPSSAETLNIVSDSSDDDSSGIGMRTLIIEGLDSNYNEITETIIMDGTTPVISSNSYLRLNKAYLDTAGSTLRNQGNVTIEQSSSTINMGTVITEMGDLGNGFFTVPNGKTAYINKILSSIVRKKGSSGVKEAKLQLLIKPFGKGFFTDRFLGLRSEGSHVILDGPFSVLEEKTDVRMDCISITNNISVSTNFQVIFVDN